MRHSACRGDLHGSPVLGGVGRCALPLGPLLGRYTGGVCTGGQGLLWPLLQGCITLGVGARWVKRVGLGTGERLATFFLVLTSAWAIINLKTTSHGDLQAIRRRVVINTRSLEISLVNATSRCGKRKKGLGLCGTPLSLCSYFGAITNPQASFRVIAKRSIFKKGQGLGHHKAHRTGCRLVLIWLPAQFIL